MMNLRKNIVYASLFAAFFITSCYWDATEGRHFENKLQGTWISNDSSAIYSGELIISYDRITITGFGERQTLTPLEGGDDNNRPFKDFTKGTALKGYSEEGKIFIEDAGLMQEGIPYIFYTAGKNLEDDFLRFTFGSRQEIMQKKKSYREPYEPELNRKFL